MKYSSLVHPVIIFLFIIAMPLYLWLVMVTIPVDVLEIIHEDSGELIFWSAVRPNAAFSLGYTHSVQLSPVLENFRLDKNCGIILVSTTFSDHGAGLPTDAYRGAVFTVQDDGGFKISNMNVFFPEISVRTGREYSNTFTLGNRDINLSKLYGDASFTIRTRKRSVLRCQIRRLLNVG